MDFSSLNPETSNNLNIAARRNDVPTVQRMLKKINPNCVDNRGWTCLHEAAAYDSYESLIEILKNEDCRPLAETHEGHTALYLACRHNSSIKTIKALLDSIEDIANYASTENVTPLHVVSAQGNLEVMQLLIDYGAMLDVQDFDGDTPMHDAALAMQHEAIALLLHAGADPEIKNEPSYTPFHLACYKGCFNTITTLFPFVNDLNQHTFNGDTALILAVQGNNDEAIKLLLDNGADPHLKNDFGELALNIALSMGHISVFKLLLNAMDTSKINTDIVLFACKPHYFKFDILEELLSFDLGPEFYDFVEPFHATLEQIGDVQPMYLTNPPLNSYLNICEYIYSHSPQKFRDFFNLFLMRGVAVNALDINECPPLVYIHYCEHSLCFEEVFKVLLEHNCNVDYCSCLDCSVKDGCIPDAFIASLTSDPATIPLMLPYSLCCEPGYLIKFACDAGILGRIPANVQTHLMSMLDISLCDASPENLPCLVLPLKHLCRIKIRSVLKNSTGHVHTKQFLDLMHNIELPMILKRYLRYL